jgi:hypothetical protein
LIRLCAKNGADAAKFQHFKAETIVSDYGFKKIGKLTHQKKWKKTGLLPGTPCLENDCPEYWKRRERDRMAGATPEAGTASSGRYSRPETLCWKGRHMNS